MFSCRAHVHRLFTLIRPERHLQRLCKPARAHAIIPEASMTDSQDGMKECAWPQDTETLSSFALVVFSAGRVHGKHKQASMHQGGNCQL